MPPPASPATAGEILLIGASRGLGLALSAEFLTRGWTVIGTARRAGGTQLHDLADRHPGRLEIEMLDITAPDEIAALRARLSGRRLDGLFVNAGVANSNTVDTPSSVSTEEFSRVLLTNALSPMRVIEGLQDLVSVEGLIGVMSSGQGSLTNNERGGNDVYRASKAALNQLMRCYAARQAAVTRALMLMAPGWIRTDMGGAGATYSLEESAPKIVDVLLAQRGRPGLRYLDRDGRTVPW
jgi:NAD(P)-dependent dehydrogenase (short-subunit alcohol dehydrogenase family)